MATLQRVRRQECFLLLYEWYGWTVMEEDREEVTSCRDKTTLEYLCQIFCSAGVGMGTGYP
jgi:hypothetical protein